MERNDDVSVAEDFLSFINKSPSVFHAVTSVKQRLENAGFLELKEMDSWARCCSPGGKYYVTRNRSTIVAFAIGKKWEPGNPISMIAAHTDSPCLRIKPASNHVAEGFIQIGVELYGGANWHTWFDRDLGLAGRVLIRSQDGSIVTKLVHVNKPVLRIPTLAIHLGRQETFLFNKEINLLPIAGLVSSSGHSSDTIGPERSRTHGIPLMKERHHPSLLSLIANETSSAAEEILGFELVLFDTQKACLGGFGDEFIFSARLDNLNMCYCATEGLISSLARNKDALEGEIGIRLMALFDHEEIGSTTYCGAESNLLSSIVRRLSLVPALGIDAEDESYQRRLDQRSSNPTSYEQTMCRSFLISADMAHAVNPNYGSSYEDSHRPQMNGGPVIKVNANAKYATDSVGISLIEQIAHRAGDVPLQLFVARNDTSCGSTIGPVLAAHLGVRTVDLGNAQLSMHSIRETSGVDDLVYAIRLFEAFYEYYSRFSDNVAIA